MRTRTVFECLLVRIGHDFLGQRNRFGDESLRTMNILIFDKNDAARSEIGARVSDLGAILHHVPHADALQQTLAKLCEGYRAGCCLVIHDSFDEIVERVSRLGELRSEGQGVTNRGDRVPTARQFQRLSPRESEVLQFVLEGMTSQEIADRLKISLRTVKMHRGNIMAKVRVRNVAELVSLYHTTAAKAA